MALLSKRTTKLHDGAKALFNDYNIENASSSLFDGFSGTIKDKVEVLDNPKDAIGNKKNRSITGWIDAHNDLLDTIKRVKKNVPGSWRRFIWFFFPDFASVIKYLIYIAAAYLYFYLFHAFGLFVAGKALTIIYVASLIGIPFLMATATFFLLVSAAWFVQKIENISYVTRIIVILALIFFSSLMAVFEKVIFPIFMTILNILGPYAPVVFGAIFIFIVVSIFAKPIAKSVGKIIRAISATPNTKRIKADIELKVTLNKLLVQTKQDRLRFLSTISNNCNNNNEIYKQNDDSWMTREDFSKLEFFIKKYGASVKSQEQGQDRTCREIYNDYKERRIVEVAVVFDAIIEKEDEIKRGSTVKFSVGTKRMTAYEFVNTYSKVPFGQEVAERTQEKIQDYLGKYDGANKNLLPMFLPDTPISEQDRNTYAEKRFRHLLSNPDRSNKVTEEEIQLFESVKDHLVEIFVTGSDTSIIKAPKIIDIDESFYNLIANEILADDKSKKSEFEAIQKDHQCRDYIIVFENGNYASLKKMSSTTIADVFGLGKTAETHDDYTEQRRKIVQGIFTNGFSIAAREYPNANETVSRVGVEKIINLSETITTKKHLTSLKNARILTEADNPRINLIKSLKSLAEKAISQEGIDQNSVDNVSTCLTSFCQNDDAQNTKKNVAICLIDVFLGHEVLKYAKNIKAEDNQQQQLRKQLLTENNNIRGFLSPVRAALSDVVNNISRKKDLNLAVSISQKLKNDCMETDQDGNITGVKEEKITGLISESLLKIDKMTMREMNDFLSDDNLGILMWFLETSNNKLSWEEFHYYPIDVISEEINGFLFKGEYRSVRNQGMEQRKAVYPKFVNSAIKQGFNIIFNGEGFSSKIKALKKLQNIVGQYLGRPVAQLLSTIDNQLKTSTVSSNDLLNDGDISVYLKRDIKDIPEDGNDPNTYDEDRNLIDDKMLLLLKAKVDAYQFGKKFYDNSACGSRKFREEYNRLLPDVSYAADEILFIRSCVNGKFDISKNLGSTRKRLLAFRKRLAAPDWPLKYNNQNTYQLFVEQLLKNATFSNNKTSNFNLCYLATIFPVEQQIQENRIKQEINSKIKSNEITRIRKLLRDRSNAKFTKTRKETEKTLLGRDEIVRRKNAEIETDFTPSPNNDYSYLDDDEIETLRLVNRYKASGSRQINKASDFLNKYLFEKKDGVLVVKEYSEHDNSELQDLVWARKVIFTIGTQEQREAFNHYINNREKLISFDDSRTSSDIISWGLLANMYGDLGGVFNQNLQQKYLYPSGESASILLQEWFEKEGGPNEEEQYIVNNFGSEEQRNLLSLYNKMRYVGQGELPSALSLGEYQAVMNCPAALRKYFEDKLQELITSNPQIIFGFARIYCLARGRWANKEHKFSIISDAIRDSLGRLPPENESRTNILEYLNNNIFLEDTSKIPATTKIKPELEILNLVGIRKIIAAIGTEPQKTAAQNFIGNHLARLNNLKAEELVYWYYFINELGAEDNKTEFRKITNAKLKKIFVFRQDNITPQVKNNANTEDIIDLLPLVRDTLEDKYWENLKIHVKTKLIPNLLGTLVIQGSNEAKLIDTFGTSEQKEALLPLGLLEEKANRVLRNEKDVPEISRHEYKAYSDNSANQKQKNKIDGLMRQIREKDIMHVFGFGRRYFTDATRLSAKNNYAFISRDEVDGIRKTTDQINNFMAGLFADDNSITADFKTLVGSREIIRKFGTEEQKRSIKKYINTEYFVESVNNNAQNLYPKKAEELILWHYLINAFGTEEQKAKYSNEINQILGQLFSINADQLQVKSVEAGEDIDFKLFQASDIINELGSEQQKQAVKRYVEEKAASWLAEEHEISTAEETLIKSFGDGENKKQLKTKLTTAPKRAEVNIIPESALPKSQGVVSNGVTVPDGLRLNQIAGDGSCLYNSVINRNNLQNINSAKDLRNAVADHLNQSNDLIPEDNRGDIRDYIDGVRGSVWGGETEIVALMRIYNRPIVIFNDRGVIHNRTQVSDYIAEHISSSDLIQPPIFIQYNPSSAGGQGNHYNSYEVIVGHNPWTILYNNLPRNSDNDLNRFLTEIRNNEVLRNLSDDALTNQEPYLTIERQFNNLERALNQINIDIFRANHPDTVENQAERARLVEVLNNYLQLLNEINQFFNGNGDFSNHESVQRIKNQILTKITNIQSSITTTIQRQQQPEQQSEAPQEDIIQEVNTVVPDEVEAQEQAPSRQPLQWRGVSDATALSSSGILKKLQQDSNHVKDKIQAAITSDGNQQWAREFDQAEIINNLDEVTKEINKYPSEIPREVVAADDADNLKKKADSALKDLIAIRTQIEAMSQKGRLNEIAAKIQEIEKAAKNHNILLEITTEEGKPVNHGETAQPDAASTTG